MSTGPTFEQYLSAKRIDPERFKRAETDLWDRWKREFEQMHPNSFTVQKLNLINAVRRKYLLEPPATEQKEVKEQSASQPVMRPGKPVIKRPGQ